MKKQNKNKIRKHGTIVISDISNLGVAMVADTAITIDDRSFVGFQKLFKVPQINAGISIWGNLNIRGTDADEWIRHFINNYIPEDMNLSDMANRLKEKLNDTFRDRLINENRKMEEMGIHGACRMGMHVAGFENDIPRLFHINNGDYKVAFTERGIIEVSINSTEEHIVENPPLREFSIDAVTPRIYEEGQYDRRLNGDIGIFRYLYDELKPIFKGLEEFNCVIPYPPTLEMRGEYLRFLVNTFKELYMLSSENINRNSDRPPPMANYMHIGGPVTVLTISKSGINSFYEI